MQRMDGQKSVRQTAGWVGVLVTGAAVLGMTGCGTGLINSSVSDPTAAAAYTISGTVQMPTAKKAGTGSFSPLTALPISGATVYLYAAGVGGYGSAATLLARTTTTTTGGGSFSFSQVATHVNALSNISNEYSCPSYTFTAANGTTTATRDSYIYLVAVGGDSQDGSGTAHNNSGSVLLAALGDCQALAANEPFVNINAVTTVASVFALAPYLSPVYPTATVNGTSMTLPGGALGTSTAYQTRYGSALQGGLTATGTGAATVVTPMGYTGLANAFATSARLASLQGNAVAAFNATGTAPTVTGVTLTGTPEQAKVNHLADILSTCTNSSDTAAQGTTPASVSTSCSTLFGLTVPPISSATTSLGAGVTLPAATDTLQAAYYLSTNPTNNTAYGASTAGSATNLGKLYALVSGVSDFQPTLTAQPTDWTVSISYSSTSTCGTDPTTGAFLSSEPQSAAIDLQGNVAMLNGAASGDTLFQVSPTGVPVSCQLGAATAGRSVVYDTAGAIWLSTSTNVYQSNGTGSPTNWPTTDGTTTFAPSALTADGKGNVFYTVVAGGMLQEFAAAQGATTPANSVIAGTAVNTANSYNLYYVAADAAGNIWSPSSGGSSTSTAYVWAPVTGGYARNSITSTTSLSTPYGAAIDAGGNLVFGNTCCAATNANLNLRISPAGSGATVTGTVTKGVKNAAGVLGVRSTAVDGAGNIWTGVAYPGSNYTASGTTYGVFGVAETDGSFNALSSNGGTGTCASGTGTAIDTSCAIGGGYQKASLGISRGLAVDLSGNVWVPSDQSSANPTLPAGVNGNLVELVGAAVPVVQPLAVAARDGKLGAKP